MKVRVLGCSGGIGGRNLLTTAFLVDDDVLVDAGTGVGDLGLDELVRIDHVFVSHSHLDHVASIAFLVDTVGDQRGRPLVVHALPATIQILRDHIFNWAIWPDFSAIPSREAPMLRFEPIEAGQTVELKGRGFRALPANHTVPAVGYGLIGPRATLAYTGDTTSCDALWRAINELPQLRYLVAETAFSDGERALASASRHLCPSMLAEELAHLTGRPELYVTHLKPGEADLIMAEVGQRAQRYSPRQLASGQVFEL